MSLVH